MRQERQTGRSTMLRASVISIRDYYQASDAGEVGRLIADTYGRFNLAFATPHEKDLLLGPFRHTGSPAAPLGR